MKKNLLTAVTAALLVGVASPVHSEQITFSSSQYDNLNYAYHFGEQFQKNGKFKTESSIHKSGLGYIMAGMAWQESSGGANTGHSPEHNAYGMFQNYLPSVKSWTNKINWNMSDAQIKKMLKNRKYSATWAYIELSYWMNRYNGNIPKAIASYNAGNNYKAGIKYSRQVMKKAEYLKEHQMFKETQE